MKSTDSSPGAPPPGRPRLASDERGCLFVPDVRGRLSGVAPEQAASIEALAAVRWAAKGMHIAMERWADRHGLSEGRLQILMRLRHDPGRVSLGDLAEMMNVSARNVTGLIDNLERSGLVARVPDPADRRSVLAQLTEAGRERVDEVWQGALVRQEPLTADFTREELDQLRHLCLRVVQNMQQMSAEGATRRQHDDR